MRSWYEDNPFLIEQPQQNQQPQQMNPMQGLQMYENISGMFGGGAAGAGASSGAATGALSAGGGTYATGSGLAGTAGAINTTAGAAGGGTAAGGGAAGAGGGLAAAGPWAALAAVIMINEEEARKAGRRDEDRSSRTVDQLSGAVLEQDMDYYSDKVGGIGGEILQGAGKLGHPEGVWDTIKGIF